MKTPMRRAVFLDKDGTLVEDDPPNTDPSRLRFYGDAFPALRLLERAGFALVLVTNQCGIAQGRCEESDVRRMLTYVDHRLADEGITLAGWYFCPHDVDGRIARYAVPCMCRKPQPGLLIQACRELDLETTGSWMVGDILHDVEAGRWAGCRTVLLNNGHETEWRLTETRWPDRIAGTLLEAAQLIVLSGEHRTTGALLDRQEEEP
jgi:D-glycero-D-manno-heptose 1,7-bisphosphate phosphatase